MKTKKAKRKRLNAFLTSVMSFSLIMSYIQAPNSSWNKNNVAEALVTGNYKVFNNTSAGTNGSNSNTSSGTLGGTIAMSNGMYLWTVPETGVYRIETRGAEGGASGTATGGSGAIITGDFTLTKGESLLMLIGQQGGNGAGGGGGGGGTFVTNGTSYATSTALIVAGGGGGASSTSTGGSATTATGNGNGGTYNSGSYPGGTGGGFIYNGSTGNGGGGISFRGIGYGGSAHSSATGAWGGFGGGGGNGWWGGGGGGGYQGGYNGSTDTVAGGGGYSYNIGTNQSNTVGNTGHGRVTITQLLPTIVSQSPANGAKFQNNYVDVSWVGETMPSGSSITKYEIQAGTTSGGSNILALTNKGLTTTQRLTVPAGTSGNTTIYWRVRAYTDNSGAPGPWKEQTVIYSNNVSKITGTGNTPANLDVSLEKRHHQFSVNSLIDQDDFNYVTLFADVLDKNGTLVPGSKKQIVLDSSLVNSASLISGTATEKDGSLQGPLNYTTPFNLKLYLEPDFTTGTFNLSLTKSDGTTNVLKSNAKLITNRAMQPSTDANPESFTLRIYPEDRQNSSTLANSPLSSIPDVTPFSIPFKADTRNYLPALTNMKDDVADRVFSDNQGFNKISVEGHVDDSDPDDSVTIYYEVQPKAPNYSIDVTTSGGKVVPANGIATQTFEPKVDADFSFIYQVDSAMESGNYALLVYGYDSQEGIGDIHEIPFTVDRGGPSIDFTADYLTSDGKTIIMSTAQKQIIAEFNKSKLYFTPNNYATFEYAGYLVRDGVAKDLRIRGAFTNEVKASFIGIDFGQKNISLLNGEQTEFKLGDVIVFKFKATSSTGVVTNKDIRLLIGNDTSTFTPLDDANLPSIP